LIPPGALRPGYTPSFGSVTIDRDQELAGTVFSGACLSVVPMCTQDNGPPYVVGTLLPRQRALRLGAALPVNARLHSFERWTQLDELREYEAPVVVVDPLACDRAYDLDHALHVVARCASLIVYTVVSASAMRRLLDVPMLGGAALILEGIDDSPALLRSTVECAHVAADARSANGDVLDHIGPLPADVERALANLMLTGTAPLTVNALARAAHMSVRTLERRLEDGQAPSPSQLIKTARAVLARRLLSSSSMPVHEVARRVGYAKLDSLRVLLRRSFNSSPSALRKGSDRAVGS